MISVEDRERVSPGLLPGAQEHPTGGARTRPLPQNRRESHFE